MPESAATLRPMSSAVPLRRGSPCGRRFTVGADRQGACISVPRQRGRARRFHVKGRLRCGGLGSFRRGLCDRGWTNRNCGIRLDPQLLDDRTLTRLQPSIFVDSDHLLPRFPIPSGAAHIAAIVLALRRPLSRTTLAKPDRNEPWHQRLRMPSYDHHTAAWTTFDCTTALELPNACWRS